MNLLIQAKQIALYGLPLNTEVESFAFEDIKNISTDLHILHDIIVGPYATTALFILQKAGFFDYWIPEIKESIELKSSKQFKEIWPHTLRVINQTPPKLTLRWAALFHDLGKAQSFNIKNGKVTFYNHEKVSAKIFGRFAKKSKIFTPGQKDCIRFLVSYLGYVESYENNWTDSAVRRFAKETGIYLGDLLILSSADITTANQSKKDKILRKIETLKIRIKNIQEQDAKKCPLPKGLGHEIIKEFNLSPGPEVGKIMKLLESQIENNELFSDKDFTYYIKYLKANKEHINIFV